MSTHADPKTDAEISDEVREVYRTLDIEDAAKRALFFGPSNPQAPVYRIQVVLSSSSDPFHR